MTPMLKAWYEQVLVNIPLEGEILEIGSGNGRDAKYIMSQGYDIECTDAAQDFVAHLLKNGFKARPLNAILDPIRGKYDLIIANSVLQHFAKEETTLVLSKVFAALKIKGRFAFSLKLGSGDRWCTDAFGVPRYICYWEKKELTALLKQTGFSDITMEEDSSGDRGKEVWLQIIAHKMKKPQPPVKSAKPKLSLCRD